MKRLILMGGRPWLGHDQGKAFVQTLLRYYPNKVNVAFCIFAQPETDWSETKKVNQRMISKFKNNRKIDYKLITAENFKEVSKWADVIYIPGGNPLALKKKIVASGYVNKLWDGKVIAGSSAGADLFCEAFAYLQNKTIGNGLGWVRASCIPHWRNNQFEGHTDKDWDWAEKTLLKKFPKLPILCIPESEFVEFSVN